MKLFITIFAVITAIFVALCIGIFIHNISYTEVDGNFSFLQYFGKGLCTGYFSVRSGLQVFHALIS